VATYGRTSGRAGADAAGAAFDALGDRTRRQILELLHGGERTVGELAGDLPVTRPAVSQHLQVLEGAGLVTGRREGTRHLYAVDPTGLAELREYVEEFWDTTLAAFAAAAERQGGER
jgi:DNA-binding transcriptional ArsR family regulator